MVPPSGLEVLKRPQKNRSGRIFSYLVTNICKAVILEVFVGL